MTEYHTLNQRKKKILDKSDNLDIIFEDYTDSGLIERYEEIIETVVKQCLICENVSHNVEISFSFVDNTEIRKYNKKFRNIDKETDVLSFPLIDFEKENILDYNLNLIPLGDIVISYEKAVEQAENYNHSIEREIAFLCAHSVFHLLGYDHRFKEEEDIMFGKQNNVLNELGINR